MVLRIVANESQFAVYAPSHSRTLKLTLVICHIGQYKVGQAQEDSLESETKWHLARVAI
jgi:hypothetical protein